MQVKPDLITSLSLPSQFYYKDSKNVKGTYIGDIVHEKHEVR